MEEEEEAVVVAGVEVVAEEGGDKNMGTFSKTLIFCTIICTVFGLKPDHAL